MEEEVGFGLAHSRVTAFRILFSTISSPPNKILQPQLVRATHGKAASHPHAHKIKTSLTKVSSFLLGGGGIRTHGTQKRTTVFKTAPINRSGTPPYDLSDVIPL